MKCPYRKIRYADGAKIIEDFGECYERQCPFYITTTQKQRYDGGHNWVTVGTCRRVEMESENTE